MEDFWRAWNNIPKPSEIFYDGRTRKKFASRTVEAFSVFKKNIKPEWEDPANRSGAEWYCRRAFTMPQLDEFWLHIVLGMIGETLDAGDEICGARVVDKSVNGRTMYRLELWFRGTEARASFRNCLFPMHSNSHHGERQEQRTPRSHTQKTHALASSDPRPQEPRRAPPPPSLAGALLYDDVIREGHAADRAAARGREGLLRLLVEQPQPLRIEQPRLEPRPRVESAPVARMQPQRLPKRGARPLDVVVGVEHRPEQRVQRRVAGRGPEPLAQRRARVCGEALPCEQHRLQLVRPPA